MRARIVIPTYNNAATLGEVLAAALPQAPVTVVDDGSTDGTAELAGDQGAQVLAVDRRSVAHARNRGGLAGSEEAVLFLDSDAVPAPDWAARLTGRLAAGDAEVVGGDVLSRPKTRIGAAYDRMYRRLDATLFSDGSVMLPGMNLAVRRDLLARVPFDESLPGALCEDVDFLIRAKMQGARIAFEPAARVFHHHPQTLRAFLRQEVRHGRGRALLETRHPSRADAPAVRSWPGWLWDATVKAPWHWAHAARAAGPDPAVMLLHHLRMAAGNWGYLRQR